jgi:Mrp family chromosome partitioning ATPase
MPEKAKSCNDTRCTKESCKDCEKKTDSLLEKTNEFNTIKKVIGIVSGKGGVGKSFVTAMLSVLMNRKGYNVGILDADITGPSIPKMFGLSKRASSSEIGIFPERTHNDIRVMSINLLLSKDDTPVIWRGPLVAGTVKQFWTDVLWGELDFMFIDMPPGTGDVPLTVFQSIPLDGIIIVTSPQELVSLIVKKAYNMARQMNIPVIGVVENMSHIVCPDCSKIIQLFGESRLDETAGELGLEVLGKVPIDSAMAALSDNGIFERFENDYLSAAADRIDQLFPQEE